MKTQENSRETGFKKLQSIRFFGHFLFGLRLSVTVMTVGTQVLGTVQYPDVMVPAGSRRFFPEASWYHWRHLKISAGPGQRIPKEIPGNGGSLFQSTSGVKYSNMCTRTVDCNPSLHIKFF